MTVPADDGLRAILVAAMPEHQHWCHAEAHADCRRADDCDCGVGDSLDRLVVSVRAYASRFAAKELMVLASRLVAADVPDGPVYTEIGDLRAALVTRSAKP